MEANIALLRCKEVISLEDGSRYGFVGDVRMDLEEGRVLGLLIPGRLRLFGLLGREEDVYIPWEQVSRFGEDIILVSGHPERLVLQGKKQRK